MSLGLLTSTLQTVKSLKDHEYIRQLQDYTKRLTLDTDKDYSHVTTRKTRLQLIRLSAAVCGIELCYAAETAFVSPILLKLGVPVALMTLVWCVSPLLGFFLVPIMGSLSDRCPSKLGRRRPFILLLSIGIIAGLILVPNGEEIGKGLGDSGTETNSIIEQENSNLTVLRKINDTNSLVLFSNGTRLIVRSDFSPNWPSLKFPHNHVAGIILTIFGVAMLDFNCDACQSPCRTYLLDISVPEDHSRGLTSFTVMAGLGGSVGYLMGGIDWESTSFGSALGGHVRVVFTMVLILYIVSVSLTVTSFKEIPLKELNITQEQLQKNVKKVKKAKYRKFVNESSEDENETDSGLTTVDKSAATYGTLSETKAYIKNEQTASHANIPGKTNSAPSQMGQQDDISKETGDKTTADGVKSDSDFSNILEGVSLKTYLHSIVVLPRSLLILCLTNLFCWMSLVCYSLYFTDFVGQSVFGGDPQAPIGSEEHNRYNSGVRLGSFGMSLYSLSCAMFSLVVEKLVNKFGARNVYIVSQLVYTVGAGILAASRQPAAVILLSPTAGIMYATLFTMPYLLVARYHSTGKFSEAETHPGSDPPRIRGLGTDVALVSSMVFLAQFLLSLFMGTIVHFTGSTVTIVIAAAILSFFGALCATQVTYLDL